MNKTADENTPIFASYRAQPTAPKRKDSKTATAVLAPLGALRSATLGSTGYERTKSLQSQENIPRARPPPTHPPTNPPHTHNPADPGQKFILRLP